MLERASGLGVEKNIEHGNIAGYTYGLPTELVQGSPPWAIPLNVERPWLRSGSVLRHMEEIGRVRTCYAAG
jgi:hypothetical protein